MTKLQELINKRKQAKEEFDKARKQFDEAYEKIRLGEQQLQQLDKAIEEANKK